MKNKKMPGQYGHEKVTILNLEVIKVDKEKKKRKSRSSIVNINQNFLTNLK
jgi:ribosomal protein L3